MRKILPIMALLLTGCDDDKSRSLLTARHEATDAKLDLVLLSQSNIIVRAQIILNNQHEIFRVLTNRSNAVPVEIQQAK